MVSVAAYGTYLAVYTGSRSVLSFLPSTFLFVLAILAGDGVNYLGNRYWVFRHTQEAIHRQGARFLLVSSLTLGMQTLLFWLGERLAVIPTQILILGLPGVRIVLNYSLHRFVTFPEPSSPSSGRAIY